MAKMKTPYLALRATPAGKVRPRWVPGPAARARGAVGQDLRYPAGQPKAGQWMDEADAHRAARLLNAALGEARPTPAPRVEVRSMAALFERLRQSPKFRTAGEAGQPEAPVRVGIEKIRLGKRTRQGYRAHMRRLEEWCGDVLVSELDPESIEEFYHDQAEAHGLAMANALMRTLRLALNIAIKKLRWLDFNPVSAIDMANPDGRLVMWEADEIAAILGAAQWCGLPAIGDAFVLGALTGQRKADILCLPEGVMANGYYQVHQRKGIKRNALAFVPITKPLLARVTAMRARKAANWPGVHHTLELIAASGKPYHPEGKAFGREWRKVRAAASGDAGAIARGWLEANGTGPHPRPRFAPAETASGKYFSDLRDTAVTFLAMAGCTVLEIANITGHSVKTVQTILEKHYFVRNAKLAIGAGVKLDAYLETTNIRWA